MVVMRGSRALANAHIQGALRRIEQGEGRAPDAARGMDRGAPETSPGSPRATDGAVGAPLLRDVLGTIRLEPRKGDVGGPYCLAETSIDCIALIETPPRAEAPDGGSNSLRQWRRRE